MIRVLVLVNNQVLVSQIEEVGADVGEPDCKLTNPFVLNSDGMLESWLSNATRQDVFMISSDKILTLTEPTPTLLRKIRGPNKIMALSNQTLDHLLEAESHMRAAIKSAAVNEKPMVVKHLADILNAMEQCKKMNEIMDMLEDRKPGSSGMLVLFLMTTNEVLH